MFANPEEAFGGTRQMLSLIDMIYESVQEPSLWSSVMDGIAEAVKGESTAMFARLPEEQLFSMTRMDQGAWDAYAAYYASVNPIMARCDAMFPEGQVMYAHKAISDRTLEASEFYNDFFKPNDMHHSMGLKIRLPDGLPAAYLSCQRPKADGEFTEREGLVYETLMPHLQRALRLYLKLGEAKSKVVGLETALDALEHAVFGLDRMGRVLMANGRAEALLREGDSLRVDGGRLGGPGRGLNRLLTDAVSLGTGAGTTVTNSVLVERAGGKGPLRVTATPFRSSAPGSGELAALVFVGDPDGAVKTRGAALKALFQLTPTEIRVADALVRGLEVREASEELGMSLETARFHTKRVLAKTGTGKQTELMRLMLSLPQG